MRNAHRRVGVSLLAAITLAPTALSGTSQAHDGVLLIVSE